MKLQGQIEMNNENSTQEYLIVQSMTFMCRASRKSPSRDMIVVEYQCQTQDGRARQVVHYLLIEHDGAPRESARAWFHRRGLGMPPVARYALRMAQNAKKPDAILVEKDGRFDRVIEEYFDEAENDDLRREYGYGLKP